MAWIAGAIAAAGGIAASVGGSLINSAAQADANASNERIADKQMDFQERMSNTAYQRGIADMRKAGLNPMLAYSQGGASAPQGASTRVESTRPGDGLKDSVNSGLSALQQVQQAQVADTTMVEQTARAAAAIADARLKDASAKQVDVSTQKTEAERRVILATFPKLKKEAEVAAKHADYDKANAGYDNMRKRVEDTLGTVGSALQVINPFNYIKIPTSNGSSTPTPNGKRYQRLNNGGVLDTTTGRKYGPKGK